MGWLLGLIISGLLTFLFLGLMGTHGGAGEVGGVVIAFLFLDLIFLGNYIFSLRKKKQKKLDLEVQQEKMRTLGASCLVQGEHMAGLPLGQGAQCDVYLCADKVVFQKDANSFDLFFDKVLDVTVKTDVEIQKQYVSSIGGAVGGAVLFGPLGAMIGGRAKEKQTRKVSRYLIYTYQKEGVVEYISFDVTPIAEKELKPYTEHYQSLQTSQSSVTL